jgi:hypothetical protein
MKPLKWRLYADNNIEREIVDHLRESKMDVLWVVEEAQLQREKDDTFHYRKALSSGATSQPRELLDSTEIRRRSPPLRSVLWYM